MKAIVELLYKRFTPFFAWLPELRNRSILQADVLAGITVALVLIPQSMAYASLAGLPPYYGLYAAFLPPMVAALFGSSRQLATGPVAVVSLLTAAGLEPLATSGSSEYVAYAILLALIVGLFQLALGLLRLGVLVNFLSHPVVLGFTNAAAIIIATSQLGKIFGVSVDKAEHHYETVWNTILAAIDHMHWPTFGIAVLAISLMVGLKKLNPKIPNVLVAVIITTVLAWAVGFEKKETIAQAQILDQQYQQQLDLYRSQAAKLQALNSQLIEAEKVAHESERSHGLFDSQTVEDRYIVSKLKLQQLQLRNEVKILKNRLDATDLTRGEDQEGNTVFYAVERLPKGVTTDGRQWHLEGMSADDQILLRSGGAVVGVIPQGLPALTVPTLDISAIIQLFLTAVSISLIGFMEAISIAKAMAVRTRQRLDANQELVGQGLSNMLGSLFQSYPVSGSFSRSAVNINAGAVTGFSSIVTSLVVVITLLFLTPLLYHLPQATLAAVIMMAVIGLVNVKAIKHSWQASRHDGTVAIITFVLTLLFAPHLENAIIVGVALSLILFLYRRMQPRAVFLSRYSDGTLREAKTFNLPTCDNIAMMRFEGSLYFANTSFFEDKVQKALSQNPDLRFLIVDGVSMNEIDATGEEMLRELFRRMMDSGVELLFCRFKKPILDMFRNTGLMDAVEETRIFRRPSEALEYAWAKLEPGHRESCPLYHAPGGANVSEADD